MPFDPDQTGILSFALVISLFIFSPLTHSYAVTYSASCKFLFPPKNRHRSKTNLQLLTSGSWSLAWQKNRHFLTCLSFFSVVLCFNHYFYSSRSFYISMWPTPRTLAHLKCVIMGLGISDDREAELSPKPHTKARNTPSAPLQSTDGSIVNNDQTSPDDDIISADSQVRLL